MRIVLGWCLSLLVCCCIWSESASAQTYCTRHFYNRSPYVWNVRVYTGGDCRGHERCAINPGETATLNYGAFGKIEFESVIRGKEAFDHSFCYIFHSGSTGAIALNDPASGDVKTCGGKNWSCSGYRR